MSQFVQPVEQAVNDQQQQKDLRKLGTREPSGSDITERRRREPERIAKEREEVDAMEASRRRELERLRGKEE